MTKIDQVLRNKLEGARRIAVLGIGSDLRGDDAAGMLAAEKLAKLTVNKRTSKLKVFFGSTAPENLTGEIKKYAPTHIVIIDTVEIGQKPGTMIVLDPKEIGEGVSFSTHKMPAKVLARYFINSIKCEIIIVGIQPASIEFGKSPSKDAKSASSEIASAIKGAVYGK